MRINQITYLIPLLCAGALFAEGKIQLKRPVSPEAESASSGGGASEKIEFAKPASAAAAETDYTTSQGPEAKSRTLYMGSYLALTIRGSPTVCRAR